jgi:ketosteroid isomerase-like protein
VDEAAVARWLDDYVAAWKSYDAAAIGALFSDDAVYRWQPWAEAEDAAYGREAIVAGWIDDQDPPGSWEAEYRPWLVHENHAVAVGVSRYLKADGTVEREYHNVFLLAFGEDGRCREFTELYMLRPS